MILLMSALCFEISELPKVIQYMNKELQHNRKRKTRDTWDVIRVSRKMCVILPFKAVIIIKSISLSILFPLGLQMFCLHQDVFKLLWFFRDSDNLLLNSVKDFWSLSEEVVVALQPVQDLEPCNLLKPPRHRADYTGLIILVITELSVK